MFCYIHNKIWNFFAKYYMGEERNFNDEDIGLLFIPLDIFYFFFIVATFWFIIPIMYLNKKIRFKCKM